MFNGSGGFSIDTDGNPVVFDTVIDEAHFNQTLAEVAAGLSLTICRDGQSVISQNIPFNAKRITNLGDASALRDAANMYTVMTNKAMLCTSVGGTANDLQLGTIFNVSLETYTEGIQVWFRPFAANTGPVTIDFENLGVKDLTKAGTVPLAPGDLQANAMTGLVYDGTRFQLITPYYTEQNWTPSVGGTATYTAQVGRITKIGRAVHVFCHLGINTIGTGSTSVISGLLYAALNLNDQALSVGDFASLATNVVWIGARVNLNATTITLRSLTAAGASATSSALLGNGTTITLSGTYFI